MNTSDFEYNLPENLIAQYPLEKRDSSRLLAVNKNTGEIEHLVFSDIDKFFNSGDVIVVNDTQVLPARLLCKKETGANVEILLHKKIDNNRWEALVKPGKRLKEGANIIIDSELGITAKIISRINNGMRLIEFSKPADLWLEKNGNMPLPPYIRRKAEDKDKNTYQTVYAKTPGAVAAPTAGLHFTNELMDRLKAKGVKICSVTLHVGMGTFRPVKSEKIEDHIVESEWANISDKSAAIINNAKSNFKKIWAVGTTAVRTIESFSGNNRVKSGEKFVDLFIYPPYKYKVVDGMITNFHLPRSSLIALVCALGGYENIMNSYKVAVEKKYRFYSYGDAMIVV